MSNNTYVKLSKNGKCTIILPFLYLNDPSDVAEQWKKIFGEPFWLENFLGFCWKYDKDKESVNKCLGKILALEPNLCLPGSLLQLGQAGTLLGTF